MVKKVVVLIKLVLFVGKVNFVFFVGFVLGQYGVNIMVFCKEYNVKIVDKFGMIIFVEILVFEDCSFIFIFKIFFVLVFICKVVGGKRDLVN